MEERKVYRILVRKPKGKNHSEDLGVDEFSRSGIREIWTGFIWLRIGTSHVVAGN
jgi:hypothetical protein